MPPNLRPVAAPALTYHDVVAASARESSGFTWVGADHYKLTPEQFDAHLDAIAGAVVTLTFDDGGASALAIADALERRARTGVFFVTTGYVGQGGFLDWDGVRELAARGHEVGSHSHTHPRLTELPAAEVAEEWRRSRAELEDALGSPVTSASTPGGFYSREVGRLAFGQGYERLYTSEPWLSPRTLEGGLVLGRFSVVATTPPAKITALARGARSVVWREAAVWQGKKVAKRVAGRAYARVRERVLER